MQSCHLQWQVKSMCALTFLWFFFLTSVVTCRWCVIFVISTCYMSWWLAVQMGVVWVTPGSRWGCEGVFPVQLFLSGVIQFWNAEVTGSFGGCFSNMYKWCHETRRNYLFINLNGTKILKRCILIFRFWCIFVLVTWPLQLPEEWPEACSSLTVVGAGTMHGFGTNPIRNPTIWLAESWNQNS